MKAMILVMIEILFLDYNAQLIVAIFNIFKNWELLILNTFGNMINTLFFIMFSTFFFLKDYLETKRLVFSRFYFLSNDELLDILANSKDVRHIQAYLPKCFFNVHQLKFDTSHKTPVPIYGMVSEEGEYMEFTK